MLNGVDEGQIGGQVLLQADRQCLPVDRWLTSGLSHTVVDETGFRLHEVSQQPIIISDLHNLIQ